MFYKQVLIFQLLMLPAILYMIKLNATWKNEINLRGIHSSTPIEFIFHNDGGHFGGIPFLKGALQNASSISSKRTCHVHIVGDTSTSYPSKRFWNDSNMGDVYLLVNIEDPNGESALRSFSKNGSHPNVLILGTWWNRTFENFTTNSVHSLWVPFASLVFAETSGYTPLDLMNINKLNVAKARHGVAYNQNRCGPIYREFFWDELNAKYSGSHLGRCNGRKRLGNKKDFRWVAKTTFEQSRHMYSFFKFIVAMEHNRIGLNRNGYVTEKIIDALLAGSIPIYAGARQVSQIIDPRAFFHVIPTRNNSATIISQVSHLLRNSTAYEEYIAKRPSQVISESSMKRFFSWHPAVWDQFGDDLMRDILSSLTELCEDNENRMNSVDEL